MERQLSLKPSDKEIETMKQEIAVFRQLGFENVSFDPSDQQAAIVHLLKEKVRSLETDLIHHRTALNEVSLSPFPFPFSFSLVSMRNRKTESM